MKLKYCSITGADDNVNPKDLLDISREYPFVEWAILFLPEIAGTPRYPSIEWIEKFSHVHKKSHLAMHLCDDALLGFIDGKADVLSLMSGFQRIQLNLKFGNIKDKYDPEKMVSRVKQNPQWQFILQYSDATKDILPRFNDIKNHAVLFDESAGRGINPDTWSKPIDGHFCGYAGGLNPDNIQRNLDIIAQVAKNQTTWIDMETGVRTNDQFDLSKVKSVLNAAKSFST